MSKYRVGVIGRTKRGDYGHGIDEVWREIPDAEIVAVADEDKIGGAARAKKFNAEPYADYREMLDKAKPNIVSICPRWLDVHHDMVIAAAERGVHIYMEKPMCRTLAEADAMVQACEKSHVKLAIAHQSRHSPKVAVVKQLLAEGKLGRVLELRGRGKEDRRGGGEDLWVLGTHVMDMIRNLGGDPAWCFANVTQAGRPIQRSDVAEGAEGIGPLAGDSVRAMYGLPNDVTAYFASQRGAAGKPSRFALQIFGTKGVLDLAFGYLPTVKFLQDSGWSPGVSGVSWQDVSSAGIGQPEPLKDGGLHAGNVLAVKELIAAIEENRQPQGSVYDARAAIEMIVAVFDSQRQGRPVSFPLETRQNPLTLL
jgi:predicted dehydrogenase